LILLRPEKLICLALELTKKAGYNPVMITPQAEDAKLVAGLKSGDEQSFRVLVEEYQDRAFSIAFGLLHNTEEAKDAVQESFIRVFKKIKGFRGESRFYTWYYRLLVNVCLDLKRKKKLKDTFSFFYTDKSGTGAQEREKAPAVNEKEGPEWILAAKETENEVWKSLELLSKRERQVFEFRHYQGFKIKDIAEIMEIKTGTVKALLFHGIQKLKKNFKDGRL